MDQNFLVEINNVLDDYGEKSKNLINLFDSPCEKSQAKNELRCKKFSEHIASSISMIILLREIAFDNFFGIQRLFSEPLLTFAPYILFRGLLEAISLSLWFSSTKLSAMQRTERYLIYRHDSLIQQNKLFHSTGEMAKIDSNNAKLIEIEENSKELGLNLIRTKKGKTSFIKMPSKTQIINKTLDGEGIYRLFSAITHGQHWAIIASSFKKTKTDIDIYEGVKGGLIEKNIDPFAIIYLCILSLNYLSKGEIEQLNYFGWDSKPLVNLFDIERIKIIELSKLYNINQ